MTMAQRRLSKKRLQKVRREEEREGGEEEKKEGGWLFQCRRGKRRLEKLKVTRRN